MLDGIPHVALCCTDATLSAAGLCFALDIAVCTAIVLRPVGEDGLCAIRIASGAKLTQ